MFSRALFFERGKRSDDVRARFLDWKKSELENGFLAKQSSPRAFLERRQNFAEEAAQKARKTTPPPPLHKSMSGKTATFDDKASPVVHADDPEFGGHQNRRFVKVVSYTMASSKIRRALANQLTIFASKKHLRARKQGELFAQLVFLLYVASCVAHNPKEGVGRRVDNASACGYNAIVPWYVGVLFYASATASNNACAWYVVRSVRADENARRATMRMVVGMVSVLSLYSTMYFPRCFWQCHQTSVWMWAISTSVLMIMKDDDRTKSSTRNEGKSKGEDEDDENDTANTTNTSLRLLAQHHALTTPPVKMYLFPLVWFTGFLICVVLYYDNSYFFFFGESIASMAYSAWAMSKHLGGGGGGGGGESAGAQKWPPRNYTVRDYLLRDASAGCVLYYLCEVINRPRLCPNGIAFVRGPPLLPFITT